MRTKAVFIAILLALNASANAGALLGGYGPADTSDAEVVGAAKFAIQSKNAKRKAIALKLTGIVSAEQQVVAGMNYRICLKVKQGKKQFRSLAVVYLDLGGGMSLTSWKPNGC